MLLYIIYNVCSNYLNNDVEVLSCTILFVKFYQKSRPWFFQNMYWLIWYIYSLSSSITYRTHLCCQGHILFCINWNTFISETYAPFFLHSYNLIWEKPYIFSVFCLETFYYFWLLCIHYIYFIAIVWVNLYWP